MSQQWRILVVEGDAALNRSIVTTLAQDGYSVQSVASGAEAIRVLWANEQHLVIGDRALPDADGFDLLRWIRTYRPNTRMMMLAAPGGHGKRTKALENGAVAYFEQPVDLRLLKVEVRRLLQQSGFSANLDSFDLLDVIQIINMSRKSIALVVHTGLEEQGMLGFQEGELIWAEYGLLRGEEAFFALAAHKNGMVTQEPWNEAMAPNVTQPLSRLIMQALQYRSKYEASQQLSGEYHALIDQFSMHGDPETPSPIDELLKEEVDDRPFVYVAEATENTAQKAQNSQPVLEAPKEPVPERVESQLWWQESARMHRVERPAQPRSVSAGTSSEGSSLETRLSDSQKGAAGTNGTSITPSTVRKTPAGQRTDLPSWLMDQPTQFEVQALRPSSLNATGHVPVTPVVRPSPMERRPVQSLSNPRTTDDLASPQEPAGASVKVARVPVASRAASAAATPATSGEVRVEAPADVLLDVPAMHGEKEQREVASGQQPRRNYPALVSALQTVGYTLPGFVAAALVGMDGQPIAQVAVDDLDISSICGNFSSLLRGTLQALEVGAWGLHEHTIITSGTHHILLRVPAHVTDVFQVLVTTRESDPLGSLDVLASVEGAIVSAL